MKLMGLKVESYCIEKSLNENLYVQIALFYFMETLNGKLFISLLKFFNQNYREGKRRFKLKGENLTNKCFWYLPVLLVLTSTFGTYKFFWYLQVVLSILSNLGATLP